MRKKEEDKMLEDIRKNNNGIPNNINNKTILLVTDNIQHYILIITISIITK